MIFWVIQKIPFFIHLHDKNWSLPIKTSENISNLKKVNKDFDELIRIPDYIQYLI